MGIVPRYTYRRLTRLPTSADELRRHTVLNLPGMLAGLSFEHTVMEPGAAVPISVDDEAGILIFPLSGRGLMLHDRHRIAVGANGFGHLPPGRSYGAETPGVTGWLSVAPRAPRECVRTV